MSEPFVGEIKMFAGNFAPRSYAFCDGQLLAVSGNDALFSLLGTVYGGDGRTTFALPELRGRIPIHAGSGPGLSSRALGSRAGSETVGITVNQYPSHTHTYQATLNTGTESTPAGNVVANNGSVQLFIEDPPAVAMAATALTAASGGGQSHTNLMETLCINFIIALAGIYPSRN